MKEIAKMGDYELLKEIGQGSLGKVFVAEHRFLKRPFVLKVLPDALSQDRGFVQRLEKEVAALAKIEHPHIVKIHNVSYFEGTYFLVTDCIVDSYGETTTLAQYLSSKDRPMNEAEILTVARQIAQALDAAYPVAHQGLKLNNILVGKGEEGMHVYLSDFGLTQAMGPRFILNRTYAAIAAILERQEEMKSGGDSIFRFHNTFLQNFAFLAPEQKRLCEKSSCEGKEDVYAFGVLIYFLLMGRTPEGVFELPSEQLPDLKYFWDSFILSCLKEDPAKRPASLLAALEEMEAKGSKGKEEALLKPILKPSEIIRPAYEEDPAAIFQKDLEVTSYSPQKKEPKAIDPLLTEMNVVPGGSYVRGSERGARDEMPQHQISVSSFAIDIHPVTNEQFVRFLESMGGEKDGNNNDIICLRDARIKRSGGRLSIESGYAKHPVVGVSWYGALAYAKWVGKRLPTEAEWEIAAYGGRAGSQYPSGEALERSHANFFNSDTTPVMSYPFNGYGLFDMAGNVYEWCQDWYSYQYYDLSLQEPENPKGPLQGVYRVLRGGCWKSLKEDLRCAHRHRNNPGTMNRTFGFRLA
ncbi:MAG: serine/threonine protein kinase, partial [Chlamydiae bacterium RIFCSPLOWO2_02_FULL_49_12]